MVNSRRITIKRIYDLPAESDGFRVLVDRLWPRGLKKADALIDLWSKAVAPTPELRKWFDHKPERFDEFRSRYAEELETNAAAVDEIISGSNNGPITLLYAARDTVHNHARVLQEYLLQF